MKNYTITFYDEQSAISTEMFFAAKQGVMVRID